MSFFRFLIKSNYQQVNEQTFLRAKVFIKNIFYTCLLSVKKTGKRMSFFPSLQYRASMAVEAALIIPIFLFFILNLLFIFEILRLQGNLLGALHQTGNQMAFAGYAYDSLEDKLAALPDELKNVILSEGYARGKVIDTLGTAYLNNTCLASGTAGMHFLKSSVMKDSDIIDLIVSYKVKPFIRIVGVPDFSMENRYYGRAWTGYDVMQGQENTQKEDRIVFVAETGTVYHSIRSCTYLCPAIKMISTVTKNDIRNENGGKYYPCERCGGDGLQAMLYITEEGSRYHNSLRCSGLKRTVYAVRLSETEGRGPCTKCGS